MQKSERTMFCSHDFMKWHLQNSSQSFYHHHPGKHLDHFGKNQLLCFHSNFELVLFSLFPDMITKFESVQILYEFVIYIYIKVNKRMESLNFNCCSRSF